MKDINIKTIKVIILGLHHTYSQNREYLCKLDSEVGDGDHGISMDRGFSAAWHTVQDTGYSDVAQLFNGVAVALMENVSGAIGPLLSVFFLEGGENFSGKVHLTARDLVEFFTRGLKAVQVFGGAKPGDKTLVDALFPAVEEMIAALAEDEEISTILARGAASARRGAQATANLQARRGRSRFVGERSIGHPDAGAVSFALLMETFAETLAREEEKHGEDD